MGAEYVVHLLSLTRMTPQPNARELSSPEHWKVIKSKRQQVPQPQIYS